MNPAESIPSEEVENLNLRSEEVQEILSYVPIWMIRWGNTMIFILIVGFLLISWFVKYPDTISAEIMVTTAIPPEKIFAHSEGQLDALFVSDNDTVLKNTPLAVIENPSNHQDVLMLKNIVDTLVIDYNDFYFPIEKLGILFLGDVAPDFAVFETNYTSYVLQKELQPFSNEFIASQLSITEAKNRLGILINQQALNKKELEINKMDLDRFGLLYDKGAISSQEYEQRQQEYLQAQRAYQSIASSISQLKGTITNSKQEVKRSQIKKIQEENTLLKALVQSYHQLKLSLKNWEINYVLAPSIDGRVSFLSLWNENQTVRQGDLVFTIIPNENKSFVGKIKAPIQNSGKIRVGQKVNINLANYPNTEFGILEGTIEKVSLVPDDEGNYLIDVNLPKRLITTYNKEIEFKQEMIGTVQIITEDLRLMERFFYQIRNIFG